MNLMKQKKVQNILYYAREPRKLYRFIEGGDTTIPQFKKENMFIQMLEGLHSSEAELIVNAKDKNCIKSIKDFVQM